MNIVWVPSPCFSPGRTGGAVDKIVIHWISGSLASADQTFQTGARQASSHFGVEDGAIHQYVKVGDTAWHAHNWPVNQTSIGIEHSADPNRPASDATYETSSELIVVLCAQLGFVPSRGLLHRHSEYYATQCSGTIDLDRLADRAVEIWNQRGIDQPVGGGTAAVLASAPVNVPVNFSVTVNAPIGIANFRTSPHREDKYDQHGRLISTNVVRTYNNGETIDCNATEDGDQVSVTWKDGRVSSSNKWYRSALHGYYISAAVSTHN